MDKYEIIKNIATRNNGEIYLGVVGAVRTGKSTLIKRIMESVVIPNIEDEYEKQRAQDEMPQSAAGKQIMTTEPKFIPNNAANIKLNDFEATVRLVDCVGYVVPGSQGYEDENGNPRRVKTPWYDEDISFYEAAEVGTEKVIKDHSTIGIVVTTDGSICDIPRENYKEAEERVISELKAIGKPFIVVLNSAHPTLPDTEKIAKELRTTHDVPVLAMNVENMSDEDITAILKDALGEFPVLDVKAKMPEWIARLNPNHWLKKEYIEALREAVVEIDKIKDIDKITTYFESVESIEKAYLSEIDAGTGEVTINLEAPTDLFEEVLKEIVGDTLKSKADLLTLFQDYQDTKSEFENIKSALKMVKQTGYGIASPTLADMKLDTPEIVKQGTRYGIKLKAIAPSIHMIKVDVTSTFEPIIGSEMQSKELIDYLMKDYETDPSSIWKSEIFGRSLDNIVQEGIQAKLHLMPENIRYKLMQTLSKVVNKGSNNMIAIVI